MPASVVARVAHAFARLGALSVLAGVAASPANAALIAEATAERVGLKRAWFNQAPIDPQRGSVASVAIHAGRVLVLTHASVLQALDAETGQELWTARIGDPDAPTLGVATEGDRCAVINGSTLYLFDAATGGEVSRWRLRGAPGAAPAIGEKHVFVPRLDGIVAGLPIDPDSAIHFSHAAAGTPFAPPTVSGDRLLWTNDRGQLYGSSVRRDGATYRFQAVGDLLAPAIVADDNAVIASREGLVYGLSLNTGRRAWRVSLGAPSDSPASLLGGMVYVGSKLPALHALDAATGQQTWAAPGFDRFVAKSAKRVYAVGADGALAAIDAESGEVIARSPATGGLAPVANTETDRLYFLTRTGLVQCLREIDADEPLVHAGAEGAAEAEPSKPAPSATPEADPFAAPPADEPADPGPEADPFADPAQDDAPADEDDPFADPFADF